MLRALTCLYDIGVLVARAKCMGPSPAAQDDKLRAVVVETGGGRGGAEEVHGSFAYGSGLLAAGGLLGVFAVG
jgi:hypothetical protein